MRKKGFTLVELLVVIAIIALLMGILMPALARVRMIAYRMICGTNLSGIGKAILLYAGDSKEAYPLPGCTSLSQLSPTGKISCWSAATASYAYGCQRGTSTTLTPGVATIGSVFYLLVRYEDTSVKQFNCKGDVGVKTFKLTDFPNPTCTDTPSTGIDDMTKAWDFGNRPGLYCSYAYQNPYGIGGTAGAGASSSGYGPNASSTPSMPIAADRNPTLDTNVNYLESAGGTKQGGQVPSGSTEQTPYDTWSTNNSEYKDKDLTYNSFAHQREGQNVLYIDGHVAFSKTANCGVDNDNIWQRWYTDASTADTSQGKPAKMNREVGGYFPRKVWTTNTNSQAFDSGNSCWPGGPDDAYLINEALTSGTTN